MHSVRQGPGLQKSFPLTHIVHNASGTMQSYKNISDGGNACKKLLSEFLGFLKYKVDNDLITMDDMSSILAAFSAGMEVGGTVEDFAGFYGQTVTNVRSVIKRRMVRRPQRKVLYPFGTFQHLVPEKWHKDR